MPDFDGNGPHRRGRMIGRGLGPCSAKNTCTTCNRKNIRIPVKGQMNNP